MREQTSGLAGCWFAVTLRNPDEGLGPGILAILKAKQMASRVLAFDNDPISLSRQKKDNGGHRRKRLCTHLLEEAL